MGPDEGVGNAAPNVADDASVDDDIATGGDEDPAKAAAPAAAGPPPRAWGVSTTAASATLGHDDAST